MSITILIGLAVVIFSGIVLPSLRFKHWIFRGGEFVNIQLFWLNVLSLLFLLSDFQVWSNFHNLLLALLLLSLIHFTVKLLPFTKLGKKEVLDCLNPKMNNKLSLMISNVQSTNRDYQGLIDQIEQYEPAVLVTFESNSFWEDKLKIIEDQYPFKTKFSLENEYGIHLFSKLPLHDTELKFNIEQGVPSIFTKIELKSGKVISVYFLHPRPPSPSENTTSKPRDAEFSYVSNVINQDPLPYIVAGDLNDVPWSKSITHLKEYANLLDPRYGRGLFSTFHAQYKLFRWPLDQILVSKDFSLVSFKRLKKFGSDHFPLYSEINLID